MYGRRGVATEALAMEAVLVQIGVRIYDPWGEGVVS
jgi:hypothetical protein